MSEQLQTDYAKFRRDHVAKVATQLVELIVECVAECEPNGPSGHLYARMMGTGIEIDTYNLLITLACDEGRITKQHHLLRIANHAG